MVVMTCGNAERILVSMLSVVVLAVCPADVRQRHGHRFRTPDVALFEVG